MKASPSLLLSLIALLLFAEGVSGQPVLQSDPYPESEEQPTESRVVLDGVAATVAPDTLPDGSVRFGFDFSRIPDGEHFFTVTARGKNGIESTPVSVRVMKNGEELTMHAPEKHDSTKDGEKERRAPSRRIPGMIDRG